MIKQYFIIFIYILLSYSNSFSQVELWELGGYENKSKVFAKYVRPNLSQEVVNYIDSLLNYNYLYLCKGCTASYSFVLVISNNPDSTVNRISISTIEDLNYNNPPDRIINSIMDSIKSISKYWRLNPKLWKIEDDMPEEQKEIFTKSNKEARTRPYLGQRTILIIYELQFNGSVINNFDNILFFYDYCGKSSKR